MLNEADEQKQALGGKMKLTNITALAEFVFLYVKRWTLNGATASLSKTLVKINEKEQFFIHSHQAQYGIPGAHEYSFVGAVIHEGKTPTSGHYTSIVLRGAQYYLVDDDRYEPKDGNEALELAGRGCLLLFKRE